MQPGWHNGELLVKVLPAVEDWEPVLRGGSNGLFMVITALSWWVSAADSQSYYAIITIALNPLTRILLRHYHNSPELGLITSVGTHGS